MWHRWVELLPPLIQAAQQKDRPWPTHVRQNCWATLKISIMVSLGVGQEVRPKRLLDTHRHTSTLKKEIRNETIDRNAAAIFKSKEPQILWCDKMCDSDTIHHCFESYSHTNFWINHCCKCELLSLSLSGWICSPAVAGRWQSESEPNNVVQSKCSQLHCLADHSGSSSSIQFLSFQNYLMFNNIVNMLNDAPTEWQAFSLI